MPSWMRAAAWPGRSAAWRAVVTAVWWLAAAAAWSPVCSCTMPSWVRALAWPGRSPRSRYSASADVGTRVQAEAPEQPLLITGQLLLGQVERGGHRQVLSAHDGEAVPGRGQVGGQARRGP